MAKNTSRGEVATKVEDATVIEMEDAVVIDSEGER